MLVTILVMIVLVGTLTVPEYAMDLQSKIALATVMVQLF